MPNDHAGRVSRMTRSRSGVRIEALRVVMALAVSVFCVCRGAAAQQPSAEDVNAAEPQFTVAHDGAGQPKFQVFMGLNLQFPLARK